MNNCSLTLKCSFFVCPCFIRFWYSKQTSVCLFVHPTESWQILASCYLFRLVERKKNIFASFITITVESLNPLNKQKEKLKKNHFIKLIIIIYRQYCSGLRIYCTRMTCGSSMSCTWFGRHCHVKTSHELFAVVQLSNTIIIIIVVGIICKNVNLESIFY